MHQFGRVMNSAQVPSPKTEGYTQTEPKALEIVDNRIYFYSEIDRASILTLNKTIRKLANDNRIMAQIHEASCVTPIYLHINSFGGGIFAGTAGMDEILKCSEFLDINTIVDGCCASAATLISIVGTKRYINKHAYMLIHQLSSGFWGKYEEIKDEIENLNKEMEMIKNIYRKYTKLPNEKLDEVLKHDLWLTAEECLKYGLVDAIL